LEELKDVLGAERFNQGEGPLIRGSHWRNFLVKYSESNRMHKKALALSSLCRTRGDPKEARRALGEAQCNDAYWHGVFGGLYLRHLRDSIWQRLSEAEGRLRAGEALSCDEVDLDLDGHKELWVHSGAFSALVSPVRGGAVEELTLFRHGINLANTLTRRREPYHQISDSGKDSESNHHSGHDGGESDTAPSIHDMEGEITFKELPPVDHEDRALFTDRVLPGDLALSDYQEGRYEPLLDLASRSLRVLSVEEGETPQDTIQDGLPTEWLEVCLGEGDSGTFEKRIRFGVDGTVEVLYNWVPDDFPEDAFFSTELSLGGEAELLAVPEADFWRFPISTFSKSERGFDETVQGESVTIRWPVKTGWGRVRIRMP
jgi:alpha-amylase